MSVVNVILPTWFWRKGEKNKFCLSRRPVNVLPPNVAEP